MRIKDIPKEAQPRYKAKHFGIETLNDAELLAIIIGSGVKGFSALDIANMIMKEYSSLQSLNKTHIESLRGIQGLDDINLLKIESIFEVHRRLLMPNNNLATIPITASSIYERYNYLENSSQEALIVVMMNKQNNIIKEQTIALGNESSVNIPIKVIITSLLLAKCDKFILIHNHPSGNVSPSQDDIFVTSLIKEKADVLDIALYDHIIVYPGGYYSFLEHNKMEFL